MVSYGVEGPAFSGVECVLPVIRYAVYGKERWSFVDASGTAQDYWHPMREYFRRWNAQQRPKKTRAARRIRISP